MSQYNERVEKQRIKLKAEQWAKGVKSIHAHSLSSMHYDVRPQDTENGNTVLDVEYNDGSVRRTTSNNEIVMLGNPLKGDALLNEFIRNN